MGSDRSAIRRSLDALAFGIGRRRINWVLDCDVQSFFDKVNQSWLIRFVEHRIGDRRIIRLGGSAQNDGRLSSRSVCSLAHRAAGVQRAKRYPLGMCAV